MDTDDREHFKTIAKVSAGPLKGSEAKSKAGKSSGSWPDLAYLTRKAEEIFVCYRRDEAHNPDMYIGAVVSVLSEYPKAIVDYICDPRTGITGQCKFLPSVAEIKEALAAQAERVERLTTYEQRVEEQLRLREEWKAQVPSAELAEKGRAWLDREDPQARELSGQKPHKHSEEEKAAFLESAKQAGRAVSGMTLSEAACASVIQRVAIPTDLDKFRDWANRACGAWPSSLQILASDAADGKISLSKFVNAHAVWSEEP